MNVIAHLRNLRIAPRKVRLVAKVIVGMPAQEALRELEYMPKRSAKPLQKLLKSAIADAEHNFQLKKDGLVVKSAIVNQGPVMKRMMPRAMGRGAVILKRMSHVTIVLHERGAGEISRAIKNESLKQGAVSISK